MADLPALLPEEQLAFHQEYANYYRNKRANFFQSLKVFRGVWDCLQLLSDIWQREMSDLEALTDQYELLPKTLFSAAQARFLTAIELGFSCLIGDAYSILRDGIESVSHAYKLSHRPNLTAVWSDKHKGEKEKKAYDQIFTYYKKKNLYPDKDGMNHLFNYYGQFCEIATHSSVTSVGNAFKDVSTPGNVRWEYHFFEIDPSKLAIFLFTLLQVAGYMEGAFFACFETRLNLDPTLVAMRARFNREKESLRRQLRAKYSLRPRTKI